MPSAAEIAVMKYFACASNDFRDRFRPVGKSSRMTALFYLMRYYFVPQQHSVVLENIVLYSFVRGIVPFRMEQMYSNGICYQVSYLGPSGTIGVYGAQSGVVRR